MQLCTSAAICPRWEAQSHFKQPEIISKPVHIKERQNNKKADQSDKGLKSKKSSIMDKDSSESEDEFHMSDYDNEPDLPIMDFISPEEDEYMLKKDPEEEKEEDNKNSLIKPTDDFLFFSCWRLPNGDDNEEESDDSNEEQKQRKWNPNDVDNMCLKMFRFKKKKPDLQFVYSIPIFGAPLCMELIQLQIPSQIEAKRIIVVGSMKTSIDLFDIETLGGEHVASLDSNENIAGKKNKKKSGINSKKQQSQQSMELSTEQEFHVPCLAWNEQIPQLLLSGQSNGRICLWNLESMQLMTQFDTIKERKGIMKSIESNQQNAIKAILWLNSNPHFFICGGDSGELMLFNCQQDPPVINHPIQSFPLPGKKNSSIESLAVTDIDPSSNDSFLFVGSSTGQIHIYRIQQQQSQSSLSFVTPQQQTPHIQLINSFDAHQNTSISSLWKRLVILSGGEDGIVKTWKFDYGNIAIGGGTGFSISKIKAIRIGEDMPKIFSLSGMQDRPWVAVCGEGGYKMVNLKQLGKSAGFTDDTD
ncbi:MAG: hypothetical protein EZS28_019200 [Streblomastix strix]|uniref:Uncharacterized protein n=1 Tax=Streblomastix strix TaxID=222440 RepID=A0A5J4VSH2_9EUKA|nr:MAG: hypothetical protein EZS28_019200 [Streblomastix strix]